MSGKPASKKKEGKLISAYYKIEKNAVKRVLPTCDRCGSGYFMADHGNRFSCGHCGFTKYKTESTTPK
ncbi:MAG: 30S ribosomal protein S27ae [Candidatus Jordarchaeaceae archaeon]